MNTVYEVWGMGRGFTDADKQRWLVDSYADATLANLHASRCGEFMQQAAAVLPKSLSARDRDIAMDQRGNPLDPRRPSYLDWTTVAYEVIVKPLSFQVPSLDLDELWPALDVTSETCATLVETTRRQWMRDELQEGAPAEPAPPATQVDWRLWHCGIHPTRPAINGLPGETGAEAFHRLLQASLDAFRANLRRGQA